MAKEKPFERRSAERIPVVEVTAVRGDRPEPVPAELLDISLTGLRFRAATEFPVDYLVRVRIDYSPISFVVRGLVVWSGAVQESRFEHGLEFVNPSAEVRTMLEDHLRSLKRIVSA